MYSSMNGDRVVRRGDVASDLFRPANHRFDIPLVDQATGGHGEFDASSSFIDPSSSFIDPSKTQVTVLTAKVNELFRANLCLEMELGELRQRGHASLAATSTPVTHDKSAQLSAQLHKVNCAHDRLKLTAERTAIELRSSRDIVAAMRAEMASDTKSMSELRASVCELTARSETLDEECKKTFDEKFDMEAKLDASHVEMVGLKSLLTSGRAIYEEMEGDCATVVAYIAKHFADPPPNLSANAVCQFVNARKLRFATIHSQLKRRVSEGVERGLAAKRARLDDTASTTRIVDNTRESGELSKTRRSIDPVVDDEEEEERRSVVHDEEEEERRSVVDDEEEEERRSVVDDEEEEERPSFDGEEEEDDGLVMPIEFGEEEGGQPSINGEEDTISTINSTTDSGQGEGYNMNLFGNSRATPCEENSDPSPDEESIEGKEDGMSETASIDGEEEGVDASAKHPLVEEEEVATREHLIVDAQ